MSERLLTEAQIEQFLKLELAIDGSNGGLIIGPLHEEGGIQVFWHSKNGYEHCAEFEGWEYLLNPGVSIYYKNTFEEINNHDRDKTDSFQEYGVSPSVRLLDCTIKP